MRVCVLVWSAWVDVLHCSVKLGFWATLWPLSWSASSISSSLSPTRSFLCPPHPHHCFVFHSAIHQSDQSAYGNEHACSKCMTFEITLFARHPKTHCPWLKRLACWHLYYINTCISLSFLYECLQAASRQKSRNKLFQISKCFNVILTFIKHVPPGSCAST